MMLKKTKGLTWPMLLFALATTLVYMGGLAALQHRCAAIPAPANAVGSGIFGRSAFGRFANCAVTGFQLASPERRPMGHVTVYGLVMHPAVMHVSVHAMTTRLIIVIATALRQACCCTASCCPAGASDFQCHRMFRFYWFIFAFVMATLLGLLITSVMKVGLHFSRPFWVGMVTISIVLMMIASEFFLGFDNAFDAIPGGFWPDWLHNPWRAATAGAIMSVVSLVLLLLAVGTE
jgi:hypothetical protein